MARKLKTYQTSLGFFDLAVAAPSMKAALEAWGADSNLFHQGAAKQSDDPDVIAATMAAPGVILKRPVGSSGQFKCIGDKPPLDHPHIYLKMGDASDIVRPYCSTLFRFDPSLGEHETDPADCAYGDRD
jgi:uncharacterized Zn-finger protein